MKPLPGGRKRAGDWDRSRPLPLSNVINFGPVTLREFEAIGIRTLDQLEDLGFEEAARLWVERFPERLNVNAFIGIVTALDGFKWSEATADHWAIARGLAERMRRETGNRPVHPGAGLRGT